MQSTMCDKNSFLAGGFASAAASPASDTPDAAACDPASVSASDTPDAAAGGADTVGYIDSVYCGSGVDGAGLRCVVFYAGCNLRCPFCHNPETLYKSGEAVTAGALAARMERYKPYFRRGGVTLSGGEPFLQKNFSLALAKLLRERGIRVAFETNGQICDEELIAAGEIICDVKNQTSQDLSLYDAFFAACGKQGRVPQVTNVLVPGKNDGEEALRALARLVIKHFPQGGVRFLPFRKLCEDKYKTLKIPFPYAAVRECEEGDIARANRIVSEIFSKNA